MTEFIIAMHLLASYKSRALQALPSTLPPGLYEAAVRRAQPTGRLQGGPWPGDASAIPRQFSGSNSQRTQSPISRPPFGTPPQSAQPTGSEWLINAKEKSTYDSFFSKLDMQNRGYITGEQAVQFFSDSSLPEDILAAIWDLADINSEGQLNRDEFAVAMYLIRQQRGKGSPPLPATLPPSLIPPSMRNQPRPVPQTTAPVFDNAAYSSQLSKSASEDLFGLDAFSAPAPAQTQQSTGGSASYTRAFESDPFGSKTTSPTASQGFPSVPRTQSSGLKAFAPTSAFGQNLTLQPGHEGQGQNRGNQQKSAVDDLLGDNDPEISKKLTQETTELANMSNQIGTLRTQMEEVQTKKVATENNLGNVGSQKRDLEARLSHFRSQYEQEAKHVKALEERLAVSQNETRKLQQELAMIEGSYQDLQNQHRQVAVALDADQRENAALKDRIRHVNGEVSILRPQLDKMRSDARQQKGLVAINKKQLATNEGEREKLKSEMNEISRTVQNSNQNPQSTGSDAGASAVGSPGQNTNPFFRKSPQPSTDNTMSPSGFARDNTPSQSQMGLDNFPGSPYHSAQSSAPSGSYRSDPNTPAFSVPSGQSVRSSEPDVPTPSASPPLSTYHESPRNPEYGALSDPRLMGSGGMPHRNDISRSESYASSAQYPPPPSKYDHTGAETPTNPATSMSPAPSFDRDANRGSGRNESSRAEPGTTGSALFDRHETTSPAASATSDATRAPPKSDDHRDAFQSFSPVTNESSIPGAFPMDANPPFDTTPTGESALSERSKASTRQSEGFASGRSDPFAPNKDQPRGMGAAKVDFDAAFAGFGSGRQLQERQNTGESANGSVDSGAANKFNREFPPIEDLANDDDSESNSERGFADNFTTTSPQQKKRASGQAQNKYSKPPGTDSGSDELYKRPSLSHTESAASGQLPPPDAQKSPPTYDQAVPPAGSRSGGRDSNQFPPEFGGLLPSRQDPTSQNQQPQSPDKSFGSAMAGGQGQALFGGSSSSKAPSSGPQTIFSASPPAADTPVSTAPSDAYHSAVSYPSGAEKTQSPTSQPPPVQKSPYGDDFDTGFEDLTEAKEADDKGDDDLMLGASSRDGLDEFNPVFDSPTASKSNTMASMQTPTGRTGQADDSFSDFEHLSQGFGQSKAPQQPSASSSHDWDAIFSGLDAPHGDRQQRESEAESSKTSFPAPDERGVQDEKNLKLGRALSAGTEHDDPILKKLTGMGYSRPDALSALEKFDYDINKV